MISLDDLDAEIKNEEEKEPSYSGLERLASMYTVRNELSKNRKSDALKPVSLSGSEFLNACSNVDMVSLFGILDEHMDAIKILHPREYMALIEKINLLHTLHTI